MKQVFTFLFLFTTILIYAQNTALNRLDIKEFVLENGLTVILNEDKSQPIIFGGVIVKAGGKDDPSDATGMAHYMEHMLFKGTEDMGTVSWEQEKPIIDRIIALYDDLSKTESQEERDNIQRRINEASIEAGKYAIPNEMDKLLKSIGSTYINAGTGPDLTVYFNAFPSNQVERWLEMYSHRFHKPVFRGFQAELEVVYEEKNMYADMFQFRLIEVFNKYFFKNHPYGQQPLIGTMEHLKNPSLSKMYDFYKTWYVPSNMALVMFGDFDSETIIPIIKEKFGVWEDKDLPKRMLVTEQPFNGRELVEEKITPIRVGLLGYRTVQAGHEDNIALEIVTNLLSNTNSTGLLDKLSIDNKLIAATIFSMPYNDHGQSIVLFVPKIVGQKFIDAENLVVNEIKRIGQGDFDESLIESIKMQKYVEYMQSLESNQSRFEIVARIFTQNRKLSEIYEYPERIMSITKDDIIRVANKYFGDNYLAFHSKMGFPKAEKIDKPGFEPIVANTEASSVFANRFYKIPTLPINENFVDFSKDIKMNQISNSAKLYHAKNPVNDIFNFKIKFGVGDKEIPKLKYASNILNLASSGDIDVSAFKTNFAALGCNYSISSDDSYFYVNIVGIDENFEASLEMIYNMLIAPVVTNDKIKILYDGERTERKMERSEADNVADALFQWVKFGSKSDYIDRLSLKEIKKLQVDDLIAASNDAIKYEKVLHYSGTKSFEEVIAIFNKIWKEEPQFKKSKSPYIPEINTYNENIIYLVNKSKVSQSKIFFLINGKDFSLKDAPIIDAHNLYFGGDFSGLVMQYVREFRSMAYSAGARYSTPIKQNHKNSFFGYIGTQPDKANEAIALFDSLVRFIPEKPERIDFIRDFLINSSLSKRPHFRDITNAVENWVMLGYEFDPSKEKIEAYKNLEFNDILNFHNNELRTKPMVIVIVTDAKRINSDELAKYGRVVRVKEKSLFK